MTEEQPTNDLGIRMDLDVVIHDPMHLAMPYMKVPKT